VLPEKKRKEISRRDENEAHKRAARDPSSFVSEAATRGRVKKESERENASSSSS